MRCLLLWTHLSLLLVLIFGSADLTALGSCPSHCGNISIPYPFGIGKGCYLNEWFEIQCKNSTSGELVPYLPKINNEVVEINLPDPLQFNIYSPSSEYGSLRIKTSITSMGCSNSSDDGIMLGEPLNLTGTPFTVGRFNILLAVGCNNRATLTYLEPRFAGCISTCDPSNKGGSSWCNGYRCCQIDMPDATVDVIGVSMEDTSTSNPTKGRGCRVAFLTEKVFQYNTKVKLNDPQWLYDRKYVIVQLQWVIPKMNISYIESLGYYQRVGYTENSSNKSRHFKCYSQYTGGGGNLSGISCTCIQGYSGNPYTLGGCKDIDECQQVYSSGGVCPEGEKCVNTSGSYDCKKNKNLTIIIGFSVGFGVLIIIGVSFWLYKFIKRRRRINRKKKLFKRNGGLLLQQQLTSTEGSIEKTIVFNSKELEKATENFSLNRVLGQGGQGTVYKGMLVDGRIVAVKKSTVVDEDKLDEFINEVFILMQINHRNIVKLLGCCLETQVPLLVYEFIPNGNLFEHLHEESDDNTVATWEVRLRIAIDIAGALSYLHSSAWAPIYHRDIKSTNIMLDEKYRAKVADFGTSRSVTVDHTHLTTLVSGTVGYLDPEYFQSSQFTDKSDVYSFGVVLVELITREKPVSFQRSQENRSLVTYFILAMKENRLVDIIDPQIRNDCKLEQVMAAAQLAKRCLNLNGKKRPNMREVSMELERIRSPTGYSQSHVQNVRSNIEEEVAVELDIGVESCNNVASVSYLDAEPLYPRQTW